MTAFEVAGIKNSDDPKIRKAVDLCSSYLPQTARCRVTTSTSIATLWKEQQSGSELPGPVDKKELATSILGEKLVDTLTEKNQQPPDVSYVFACSLHLVPNIFKLVPESFLHLVAQIFKPVLESFLHLEPHIFKLVPESFLHLEPVVESFLHLEPKPVPESFLHLEPKPVLESFLHALGTQYS